MLTENKTWLVTGVGGFIGSHLLEYLLIHNQNVVGVDNFCTGRVENLKAVEEAVGQLKWQNFKFTEGDITDYSTCEHVMGGVDYVLHQAALGSVPRSIADPLTTNEANITGFLNVLHASSQFKVERFVYAASSSTYGDSPTLPKSEAKIGRPLSPYAVTKLVNELYADVYHKTYGIETVGLRYFNVFGPRQDPNGAYAAVIPRWINSLFQSERIEVYGDGETSRDFCYIDNVVNANILSAISKMTPGAHVLNIACGQATTLNQLHDIIRTKLGNYQIHLNQKPIHLDERKGDIKHSLASIERAKKLIGYKPIVYIEEGINKTIKAFIENV